MVCSGLQRGLVIGIVALLATAGLAEAGNKGRGGNKHSNKGCDSGPRHSYRHSSRSCSSSSSSFSFSFGSGSCGSGYSVGYGYSSGGWCAPRSYRPACSTWVRPSYVCAPRYVVRDYCPPTYIVERPVYIVSDSAVTTYRSTGLASTQQATDYRTWQAETQLAERATADLETTVLAKSDSHLAPPAPAFNYVVETELAERRPTRSVVTHGRAPLPDATEEAMASVPEPPAAEPAVITTVAGR